jgi:hypothetical protein
MSVLKRLWTRIVRFVEALEGIDDPIGHYMSSVGKRVEKLESAVEHLEGDCLRALTAAGYSSRPLKPRFTLIERCWR